MSEFDDLMGVGAVKPVDAGVLTKRKAPPADDPAPAEHVPVATKAPVAAEAPVPAGISHLRQPGGLTLVTFEGQEPYTGRIMPRAAHWPANYKSRGQMTPDELRADDAKAARIVAGLKAEGAN